MLGQRIRELRKQKKLTQDKLAKDIITRSYLSQIENDIVQPSHEILIALSDRLECSVEDFFKNVENKEPTISQIRKNIKMIESYVVSNLWDKVKVFIKRKELFDHSDISKYDRAILNWIHGRYYEYINDFNRAIFYLKESISLFKEENYVKEAVRSLDSLGHVYNRMSDNESALIVLNEGYKMGIYEQIGGILYVSLLTNLGIVHGQLHEYNSAINFLEEAVKQNEEMGTYYKSGEIFMALGICYMELQRFDEAKKLYEKALIFFELSEDKIFEAGTYTNLGILLSYKKEFSQAQLSFKTALNMYTTNNAQPSDIMNVQVELARNYFLLKNYESAKLICQEVISNTFRNKHSAQAYELLGDIYHEGYNEKEIALNYYMSAIESYAKFKSPEIKQTYKKIGDVYFTLKNFEKSSYFYQESWISYTHLDKKN